MRIIAGTARSLPLKAPEGMDTRPTTDRIKETLFNIIQDEVPGAYFLDLFAGSGQMGLEAVSRGARYAVFVDNGKKPAACIEENIRFTKFEHQTKLYPTEVLSALRAMEGKYQFDLIFMDPALPQGNGAGGFTVSCRIFPFKRGHGSDRRGCVRYGFQLSG